jgi:tripartite ATP-independent transporter DctM subunit
MKMSGEVKVDFLEQPQPSIAPSASRVRKWFLRGLQTIEDIGKFFVVLALVSEIAVIITDVTVRTLSGYSLLWGEEASKLALSIIGFIGGALAYRAGTYTAVEIVAPLISPRARLVLSAVIDALVLLSSVALCISAFQYMEAMKRSSLPMLGINAAWMVLPFFVGMILLTVFALEKLLVRHPLPLAVAAGVLCLLGGLALGIGNFARIEALNPGHVLLIVLALFLFAVMVGVHVGFAMVLGSFLFFLISGEAPAIAVAQNMADGIGHYILLCLPFFIAAGLIMERSGISYRIIRFAVALIGHFRGGLLQVVVVTIYFISGISGSKAADVAAIGSVMRRELTKYGYKPEVHAAVLASSAAMSETIPPSIAMLVLASVAPISLGTLFVAGLLPAAIIAILLMILIYFMSRSGPPRLPRATFGELKASAIGAIFPMLMPVVLVIGIKSGVATPTEVSAFAVIYGLILGMVFYRSTTLRELYKIAIDSTVLTGMILFIVAAASSFAWIMSAAQLPAMMASGLDYLGGQTMFMIASIILIMVVGALVEGLPALIILGPLLLPMANNLGIDSIHYSLVMILAMGVGIFVPPIGLGFYIACSVAGSSIEGASKVMLPFFLVLLAGVFIVAFVPWFTHVVPALLSGKGQ